MDKAVRFREWMAQRGLEIKPKKYESWKLGLQGSLFYLKEIISIKRRSFFFKKMIWDFLHGITLHDLMVTRFEFEINTQNKHWLKIRNVTKTTEQNTSRQSDRSENELGGPSNAQKKGRDIVIYCTLSVEGINFPVIFWMSYFAKWLLTHAQDSFRWFPKRR